MAGESAEEVARRTREKIARLSKHAERFEKGAAGEVMTAAALAMLPAEWVVLHDVRWPGRREANIDHVAVGPGGVFVIDSKNWTGRVQVRDGVLRRDGYRRQRETSSCVDAAVAVAGLVPSLDPRLVHPVLCLVGRDFSPTYVGGALVCSTSSVKDALRQHPVAMAPTEVRRLAVDLRRGLQPAVDARRHPRANSPSRRPPGLARILVGLGLFAILGLGLIMLLAFTLPRVADRLGSSPGGKADEPVRLGTTQELARATGRPPLSVTADRFRTVRTTDAVPYLFPGNRWAAARVTIHNAGRKPWQSKPGTIWTARDVDGAEYPEHGDVAIAAGPTLPSLVHLPPGKTRSGWIVFQVPLDKGVVQVTVTVGPGQPAMAAWAVDRQ